MKVSSVKAKLLLNVIMPKYGGFEFSVLVFINATIRCFFTALKYKGQTMSSRLCFDIM